MILRSGEMSTLVVAIGLPEGSQRPTRGQAVPRPSTSLCVSSYLILKKETKILKFLSVFEVKLISLQEWQVALNLE